MCCSQSVLKKLAVLLCALLVAACASLGPYPEAPRVSLVSIQPQEVTLFEQRFAVQLRVMNPNAQVIPVSGLSYALEINEREFAYGVSPQSIDIPAFGEAVLDVEISSSLLSVVRQLQTMGDAARNSLDYRLAGKINLANRLGSLPFDYTGKLNYLPSERPAAPSGK
jgi:LEA14-like dessication related protein